MLIKDAIILAAGLGTRISRDVGNLPKPLVKISNIPLIIYSIVPLLNIGIKHLYIVVNPRSLRPISRLVKKLPADVQLIENKAPERDNGYSLILGMECIESSTFFLTMSDHIYDPTIPNILLHKDINEADIIVGADSNPRYVNINEATKILAHNEVVQDIGKNITEFSHIDIGLFIMKRDLYDIYYEYAEHNHVIKLSSLIRYSITQGKKVVISDINGLPWIDIDTIEDVRKAKTKAGELLRKVINIAYEHVVPL